MASGKINGTGLRLSYTASGSGQTAKLISDETSISIELTAEEIDVTSKDDNEWGDYLSGRKSGTVSGEAIVNFTPSTNRLGVADMYEMFGDNAQQNGTFTIAGPAAGDIEIDFAAILTGLTMTGAVNEGATFSFTLRIKQAPEIGAKAA